MKVDCTDCTTYMYYSTLCFVPSPSLSVFPREGFFTLPVVPFPFFVFSQSGVGQRTDDWVGDWEGEKMKGGEERGRDYKKK